MFKDIDSIYRDDCIDYMKTMPDDCVDLTLTDIPYEKVSRESNGLRNLDKEQADIINFELEDFLTSVYRITKGTIIIFCGKEQLSTIYNFFDSKQKNKKGTVRQLIWNKTNPSPMNGEYVYLSGVENAVRFKKKGGVFNARCKNTVFNFPCGRSKLHPTEKNHDLIRQLLIDNSNENQVVFDPCMGSGTHLYLAKELKRKFIGVEIYEPYFRIASERILKNNVEIL